MDWRIKAAANSTLAIGGVSCSAASFVVAESFVLRINICGEKPAHRQSAKRLLQCCSYMKNKSGLKETKKEIKLLNYGLQRKTC
jgi:hypothetical protein